MADELTEAMGLEGDPTPAAPAAPAAPPPPAEPPYELVDGFRIPRPEPEAPQSRVSEADVSRAREDLAAERERRQNLEREYYRAEQDRNRYQREVEDLQAVRRREHEMYEQARRTPMPTIEDPSVFAEDPRQISDYVTRCMEWQRSQLLAEMAPAMSQLTQMAREMPSIAAASEHTARRDAAALVQEQYGWGDFEDLYPDIRQTMEQTGNHALLRDPKSLQTAYLVVRSNRGMPLAPTADSPPPAAPTAPSATRHGGGDDRLRALTTRLGPMAAEISRQLGIDGIPLDSVEDFEATVRR